MAQKGTKASWPWLTVILILAAALRVAWILYCDTVPVFDFLKYHLGAVSLAGGDGYRLYGNYTAFEPIGLGAWLAALYRLFGADIFVAKVANVVLNLGIILLTWMLGNRFFGRTAGLLAAGLVAISPRNIVYTSVVSTENLFTFLLLLGAVLMTSREFRGKYVLLGITGAFLAFTKPFMLLFPGLVFLVRLIYDWSEFRDFGGAFREGLRKMVFTFLVMAVVIAPWTYRNWQVFGKFIPISTNGGITLYLNNNDYAKGHWQDPFVIPGSPIAGMRNEETGFWDEIAVDEIAGKAGRQWILENPGKFFRLGFTKSYHVYKDASDVQYAIDYTSTGGPLPNRGWIYTWSKRVYLALMAGVALSGVMLLINLFTRRENLNGIWTILAHWLLFSATFFVFEGQPRYLFPMLPFLILLASFGLTFPLGWKKKTTNRSNRTSRGRKKK